MASTHSTQDCLLDWRWLAPRPRCALGVLLATAEWMTAAGDAAANLGAIFNVTDDHHLLVFAGRSLVGPTFFQAYFAYQLTVCPK